VSNKLQMTQAKIIIRIAELTNCTAPQCVKATLQPLLDLAISQIETIHEQAERIAMLQERMAPIVTPVVQAVDVLAAYRETVP
jgi:hypothetical protein